MTSKRDREVQTTEPLNKTISNPAPTLKRSKEAQATEDRPQGEEGEGGKRDNDIEAVSVSGVAALAPVLLNNGVKMPCFGLGLSHHGGFSSKAVMHSIACGVRLFDTAQRYGNERQVGECIRASGLPRSAFFLSSKIWPDPMEYKDVQASYLRSCSRMGVKYLDLFLVHWPGPRGSLSSYGVQTNRQLREKVWRGMAKLALDGQVRAIGVSNFSQNHLEQLIQDTAVVPTVNQIELNFYQYPKTLLDFCGANNIMVEGYCPLAKGQLANPANSTIQDIAKKHGRSAAQVAIRWSLMHGAITIPKSVRTTHIDDNCAACDETFVLDDDDMAQLDDMHQDLRVTWDPSQVE